MFQQLGAADRFQESESKQQVDIGHKRESALGKLCGEPVRRIRENSYARP
jgi:hypothetical protein